jgi:hypothetical protein
MSSSGMCRCEALARADDSEECIASIFRVIRISQLGTLTETSICSMLKRINHCTRKETIEWDTLHGGRKSELLQQCHCHRVYPLRRMYNERPSLREGYYRTLHLWEVIAVSKYDMHGIGRGG